MSARRRYTDAERSEALALSLAKGPLAAARELGIPARTLASWRVPSHAERGIPKAAARVLDAAASNSEVVGRLWETLTRAVDQLDAQISKPNARLGDVARSVDSLLKAHELLSGRPTDRTEVSAEVVNFTAGMNPDEQVYIAKLLRQALTMSEALSGLTDAQMTMYQDEQRWLEERYVALARGEVPLVLGPGPVNVTPDEPLTPDELAQLAQWAAKGGAA